MVPTSWSEAPLFARIEGTRKSPPIATSSPRETATVPAVRERVEGEEERRGRIRDRKGVEVVPILREEREEERPHVLAAPPACPGQEVVFERRETRGAARRGDGLGGERSAPEVRVQEDARRIHDAPGPGRGSLLERPGGGGQNRLGRVALPGTLRAPPVGRLAEGLLRAGSSVPVCQRFPGGALEEAVHGGRPRGLGIHARRM